MTKDRTAIRLLTLLALLHKDVYWSVDRLAYRFGVTKRTIYRDLENFEELNFNVVKDEQNRYKISSHQIDYPLPEFEPDEYIFMREVLASVKEDHPLREILLSKINENLETPVTGELNLGHHHYNIIQAIAQAIDQKSCLVFEDYYSLRSDEVKDRLVLPMRFIRGMRYVLAYDVDEKQIRQFKLDRIGEVKSSKKKAAIGIQISQWNVDDFFMNGDKGFNVKIGLTARAANLLIEEYGVKKESLESVNNINYPYLYSKDVYGLEGVGRFVMGLLDQVKVYSPEKLKTYIRKKISSHQE